MSARRRKRRSIFRVTHGARFPIASDSVDAVLLCYVLHHAQDVSEVLSEVKRVLRPGGVAIIYEDIPETFWDRFMCAIHNRQWRERTGPCTFRNRTEWRALFEDLDFEVIAERQLSRMRNLMHPVLRSFYLARFSGSGSIQCVER